jgi:hypothetical protein
MKLVRNFGFFVSFACAAAYAKGARADGLEGAIRVGLDATLAEYVHVSLERQDVPMSPPSLQPDLTASRTTLGVTGAGAGVRLAGGLSDSILLGARVSVGNTKTEILSQSTTATAVALVPSMEFILGASETAYPFLSLDVGYTSLVSEPDGGSETTSSAALVGAGLGIHSFVTPSFSIDPGVNVFYTTGSIESGTTKYDQTGVTVWFNVGLSGWIRRQGDKQATASPPNEAAAPPAAASAEPQRVSDDRGRLTTSVALDVLPSDPPGQRLRLVVAGEPRTDGSSASLTVMGLVGTKEDAACATADLSVEGVTTPLSEVRSSARPGFAASEFTLQTKVDVHTLEKLGESHGDAAIGICGIRRAISPASRTNVYAWVEQFRNKARAAGTWKDAK